MDDNLIEIKDKIKKTAPTPFNILYGVKLSNLIMHLTKNSSIDYFCIFKYPFN